MEPIQEHSRLARFVLVAGITVWIVNALVRWWSAAPLGHDEARYALDARDWLGGHPSRFLYAGGGMTLMGVPGVLGGASEHALRVVPVLFGAGFLASAWFAARVACGPTTAAWTVGVLAGGRTFTTHSAALLSDLPSAACLLAAIALLLSELSRDEGPRWRLVAVAPLCAAAFHLRYGSCIPIAAIGVTFLVLAHALATLRSWPVVATLLATLLVFLPHALWSIEHTGSPLGILRLSAAIPPPPVSLAGFVERPIALYGLTIAPLSAIGVLAARHRWQPTALLWIALAQLLVLSLTTQAQARYVFLATTLLVILGTDALVRIVALLGRRLQVVASMLALAVVVASWCVTVVDATRYRTLRAEGPADTWIAVRVIRADRGESPPPCEVLGLDTSRLEWYTGCTAVHVASSGTHGPLYEVRKGLDTRVPEGARLLAFVPGIVDIVRLR